MRSGQVLIVCTGNVCRSPFIERLLRRHLDRLGTDQVIHVESAGTGALAGEPMDPTAAELLVEAGGDPDGFVARQLTEPMVAGADLVLTAERFHRGQVASLHPRALRYTFAFLDFADLAGQLEDGVARKVLAEDGLPGLVATVARRRGMTPPLAEQEADIVDPFRQRAHVFTQMSRQVLPVLPRVAQTLAA